MYKKMNLQFFADKEEANTDKSGEDDGNQEDKEPAVKTFTQKEVDAMIKQRLARVNKVPKEETKESAKEDKSGNDSESEVIKELKALREEAAKSKERVACADADIAKDHVKKAVALAKAYIQDDEDLTLDEALEKVAKEFPQLTKSSKKKDDEDEDGETTPSKAWGGRQGSGTPKVNPVTDEFKKRNPWYKGE